MKEETLASAIMDPSALQVKLDNPPITHRWLNPYMDPLLPAVQVKLYNPPIVPHHSLNPYLDPSLPALQIKLDNPPIVPYDSLKLYVDPLCPALQVKLRFAPHYPLSPTAPTPRVKLEQMFYDEEISSPPFIIPRYSLNL